MRNYVKNNRELLPEDTIYRELIYRNKKQVEKKKDMVMLKVFICILLIFLGSKLISEASEISQSNKTRLSVFPETWICPNRECQFENYDGIEYCALCGTKRYRRIPGQSSSNNPRTQRFDRSSKDHGFHSCGKTSKYVVLDVSDILYQEMRKFTLNKKN